MTRTLLTAETGGAPASPASAGPPPVRTIALGTAGSLLMLAGSLGAAAVLVPDPVLGTGPLSWLRFGHGRMLAGLMVYAGFGLLLWAWVRLGRHVLAGRVGTRPVLAAAACWTAPLLVAPALFSRDVYSYLAQGAITLRGLDPYAVGPAVLDSPELVSGVHPFWMGTPAPYGPLFILLAKGVVWITGTNVLAGVILMRLVLTLGIVPLLWALPRLVRHLGGNLPVAAWLAIAGPVTVVHLIGGPHNDVLMIGLLAAGTALVLERRHLLGIALLTLAVAIKATAVVALPFLVWIWTGHLDATRWRGFARAAAGSLVTVGAVFAVVTVLARVDLGWISMLSASSRIVNWLSLSTAVGELLHALTAIVADVSRYDFVAVTRLLGMAALAAILVRQWWLARDGGPDAVRRAAIALLAVAVLSPSTLPWYLTWSLVLAAGLAWRRGHLAIMVAVAAFLVVPYSPDGETLLYVWPFMAVAIALSVLAGVSLVRPDPLGLGGRQRPVGPTTVPDSGASGTSGVSTSG
ncbi:MAG TPA: polyprenol phosphomannose-dependent alpha 1,6 mannosyltransferase MptB [Actinophytocola sp.]|uniref:polyprenol phosphomannose-dependent alpha 1,6 mannosyltransferase MptB n=1 Tax=Actinophytocola sp. TaxID=1872138 RepID=UPI002DDD2706|nr:polyprenol phosphomannose-dependent alpha 1,6 mannosyltransferase MptB [Actinophytocola sp.]HEV2780244.1 polyprenol phosphomannose-dependent alpha 1,6 mannosyltransferase MptB [Actinophytocola sp.]